MKDTAPKWLGVVAVATMVGIVAWVASYVVFDFAAFAAFVIGAVVGTIAACVLWLGWRDAAPGPTGPRDLAPDAAKTSVSAPAATAPTASDASATASAAPAAAATPAAAAPATAPAASDAKPATNKPAAKKPAAKAGKSDKTASKPAAKSTKTAAKTKAAKPVAADGKPDTLSKPRAGGADDLKQLKGVGPGLEKTLNELGFYHFDQVASWRKKEIEWVDSRLKFKGRIERDGWVKQAKTLAKGGETEFAKKVKKGDVY